MCDNCVIDLNKEIEIHKKRVSAIIHLSKNFTSLAEKSQNFAKSLIDQFVANSTLSYKQWDSVLSLRDQITESEPVYGSFAPILVMFRLTGERGLKAPRVRLLTKEGRYVQLNFNPDNPKEIKVYVDGWQGHGKRKFAGWIYEEKIVPYNTNHMSEDVKLTIQELSLDPIGTSKAMANKLGVCIYCGKRLSDEVSKKNGYGPICAKNWKLPWVK